MRRFIAVFSLSIFIIIHFLSFQPVSAVSSVDYGEMLNIYLGAAETALAASQGVTIDWSNLDLPEGSDTWTDQEKAQYIVSYIGAYKKVGQKAIYDWLFGEGNDTQDIVSAETAAIGLSSSSNINTLDIKAQLDNILATQSQDHIFQRYSDKVIARWNEYNTNYINNYLNDMNYVDSDIPDINVPDQYVLTCQRFAGFTQYNTYTPNLLTYPFNDHASGGNVVTKINFSDYSFVSGLHPSYRYCYFPLLTISVDGSGDSYTITYPNVTSVTAGQVNNQSDFNFFNLTVNSSTWQITDLYYSTPEYYNLNSFQRNFSTLDSAISYLYTYFTNINLYVNGTAWALPGYVIDNPQIGFSLPDAVIDNSSEDGKIVAHPIYYPDTMNTDKAIDIDLDKVVDAIASRIAQGDTDITFDDLVDAGAAVKLDGTTLTDADTVVKDVSVPIARAKVDTIDGVIPTIDVIPPLPPLPPINPGDYSGEGFSGMSVLARIINTTVQSLPAPVILTFFGVVFGAVILGIIKILHH